MNKVSSLNAKIATGKTTYSKGDIFINEDGSYWILCIHACGITLNSLKDGGRWNTPKEANNYDAITQEEFNRAITSSHEFTKVDYAITITPNAE